MMSSTNRISITAGEVEIDLEGSAIEVDEKLAMLRDQDTWTVLLEYIKDVRESAIETAQQAAREAGLPERGSAFRALLENCRIEKKPDQVLAAIHYLKDVEGIWDTPPRTINKLFEDAGINPPGNLSLYLNRLREREFLVIPEKMGDKNRYAVLTQAGRDHLDKRSNS